MKTILTLGATLCAFAAPTFAQELPQGSVTASSITGGAVYNSGPTVRLTPGAVEDVISSDWEQIGTIADLVMTAEGQLIGIIAELEDAPCLPAGRKRQSGRSRGPGFCLRYRLNAGRNAGRGPVRSRAARDVEIRRGELESFEAKGRADRAARQCPVAGAACRLPPMRGHNYLRPLSCHQIPTKCEILRGPIGRFGHRQDQRRTGIEMPDLGGIDPVPVACFGRLQQEIDAGARRAAIAVCDPCLPVMSTFGMGDQAQARDDLGPPPPPPPPPVTAAPPGR